MAASHTGLLFRLKSSITRGHNVIYDCKLYWSVVRLKSSITRGHNVIYDCKLYWSVVRA